MKAFINDWMDNLFSELEGNQLPVLRANGARCAGASGMLKAIDKHLEEHPYAHKDLETLGNYFQDYVFKDHTIKHMDEGFELTYEFEGCVCPVMKEFEVQQSYACQCTLGFIEACIKRVSGESYQLELIDSYIKNDKPCRFMIR